MTEETIAELDGDWSEFSEAERLALGFARRLTREPHLLAPADIDELRKHFSELQILEIAFSVGINNYATRWKEAIGIPQEPDATRMLTFLGDRAVPTDRPLPIKSFLTPTSDKHIGRRSSLAPPPVDPKASGSPPAPRFRPRLESREATERALAECRVREPAVGLVDEDQARALLPSDSFAEPLPHWVRLLANFPRDGKNRILAIKAIEDGGDLTPLLKAQVSWVAAREDRAWYALGRAQRKLRALGQSDDEIYKLDGPWDGFPSRERATFAFARKLTANPELLTDADVARVCRSLGDRDTVQLISFLTCDIAFFNRVTEVARLPLQ